MEKENKKRLQLGLLITIAIILFIVGIFLIGSKQEMFKSTIKISTVFRDVNGLRKGDYVRYSGVRVGVIGSVTFISDTSIKVEMNIEKNMKSYIYKDAIAYIASDGLVGNKIMNIKPGDEGSAEIESGDEIKGVTPYDMEVVYKKLFATNDNIGIIVQQLADVSTKLNKGKGILQTLMNDSLTAGNFKSIIDELKITSENTASFSASLEDISLQIKNGEGIVGTLTTNNDEASKLKDMIANFKSSSENIDSISKNLSVIINQSQQGNNAIHLLTADTAFASSLKQSLLNIQSGTVKLNEDLEALKSNFLLRGYFKKNAR